MSAAIAIWCLTDNKPGHRSQLLGLGQALTDRINGQLYWLAVGKEAKTGAAQLARQQKPTLILCAGHRTHWQALGLRWRYGGKLIVLLKPSLPTWLFNLCVIPEHDQPGQGPRILSTCGTLNDIHPTTHADPKHSLLLIGGPSHNHGWDEADMLQQLKNLVASQPEQHWLLTTSRRTPAHFITALSSLANNNFKVVPVEETDRDWLRRQYARCGRIWVSEDSASMVYEALTAGAQVGILAVPRLRQSRVSRGLDQLLQQGRVTSLAALCETGSMSPVGTSLNEAARVAGELLTRFDLAQAITTGNPSAP
ncbi:MAG: mitochondrial fission ELM1 family protein [Parahaliea sp.]